MSANKTVSPTAITRPEFDKLLEQYPALLDSVSAAKGNKPGQRTLKQLDDFRYNEAPEKFGKEDPERPMSLDDVKVLVEWKLRHGKFRPTLMSLVSSNDPAVTADIIQQATSTLLKGPHAAATTKALDILTRLKGIGPATASLLLSVLDPAARAIFFSDEAFYWLCCGGRVAPIKYNAKEYRVLCDEAAEVVGRLGVSAADVEKVAYVLIKGQRQQQTSSQPQPGPASKKEGQKQQKVAEKKTEAAKPVSGTGSKRKDATRVDARDGDGSTLRRSKRTKS